jgi:hypothetical protein
MNITEIQKEIIALEKEKKNFARRINYKIKHLKSQIEASLEEAELEPDALAPKRETPSPALEELESAPQEEDEDAPLPMAKTFEIAYDDMNDYDIFFNNMWHTVGFSTLKQGDIFRVRCGTEVLKFYDGDKFLAPTSFPKRNELDQVVIRVKVFNPDE